MLKTHSVAPKKKPAMGGGKSLYVSPLAETITIHGGQVICQSLTQNAIPDMGWGGNYNTEPVD